jgi:hypothetical protein
MFGEHLAERPAKIRPRRSFSRKLFAAIERGATVTCAITTIRQRYDPVVNQPVFGRVDLSLRVSQ